MGDETTSNRQASPSPFRLDGFPRYSPFAANAGGMQVNEARCSDRGSNSHAYCVRKSGDCPDEVYFTRDTKRGGSNLGELEDVSNGRQQKSDTAGEPAAMKSLGHVGISASRNRPSLPCVLCAVRSLWMLVGRRAACIWRLRRKRKREEAHDRDTPSVSTARSWLAATGFAGSGLRLARRPSVAPPYR